ncbi:hypothetical protein ACA910_004412 [Epithemia clementina (nom. ined.)]
MMGLLQNLLLLGVALIYCSSSLTFAFVGHLHTTTTHSLDSAARASLGRWLGSSTQLQVSGLEGLFPSLGGGSKTKTTGGSNFVDDGGEFEASSFGLIRQARRLLASDFGIVDPSLLADGDEFIWIGPFVDEPLGKLEYLAAGRFFDLRAAFPDLDYRPHDFRIDDLDPLTIRITCRVTGTMRGALRLRDGTLPPTGKRMKCPPETASITFNQNGKVVKLCTGFCMDRQVGNTKGSTGVMAAALVAGQAPSDWDLYPAPAVLNRFFGRPVEPILESKSVLAPFPETVMIQLAKGILATNMAFNDPSLLADNFEFNTPYVGPIRKQNFITNYALQEFENVDPSFSHFRVDPYDPVRVWVDVLPKGEGYQGCPQAMSFTFDEEGFCVRLTSSYVLDPSIGNGGGLGGPEGYRYAMGKATPDFLTRPLSRVVGRARKQVLSPLTGVGVDDYVTSQQAREKGRKASFPRVVNGLSPSSPPKMLQSAPVESLSALRASAGVPPVPQTSSTPKPPRTPTPSFSSAVADAQGEILRRATEAQQEEAKLKQQGRQEANFLMKEVEAAESKALEARARLAKMELQRAESERRAKLAQEKQAMEAAQRQEAQEQQRLLAEQNRLEAQQARVLAAQQAKERAAEVAAHRAEANRLAADERRQRQQAIREEAERKRAEAEADRQAAAAKRKQELEAQKAEYERKREAMKAEAEAKRASARKQLEDQKTEAQRQRDALKAAAEAKRKKELDAKKKLAETQKAVEAKQKQRQLEAQKAKEAAAAKAKTTQQEKEEADARVARQQAALESLSNAVTRATISLFGLGGGGGKDKNDSSSSSSSTPSFGSIQIPGITTPLSSPSPSPVKAVPAKPATAPRGVPTLKRWRKTANGAITGIISGSSSFDDGDRITTSPIASGTIASGEVVRTGSGSRYFLS